jgi:predicted protein tyrosine phosphatase
LNDPYRVLFVCSQNRLRSPTAERVFADDPTLAVRSAGIDDGATVELDRDLLRWAELIVVMERRHEHRIRRRFRDAARGCPIVCLHIPDEYDFMDPELVRLLRLRAGGQIARWRAKRGR